jgi:hypothetical protein
MAGAAMGSERFEYDDTGKTRRSFQLDGTGREISCHSFYRQTDANQTITTSKSGGKLLGRTVEILDNGLLTCFASYNGENILQRKKTFQYSGTKLQTSDSRYYIPDETLIERWLSTYDDAGRIAETYSLNADGQPLGDGRYKYEYDPEGRVSRLWTLNEFDVNKPASRIKIYEYETDGGGNWVERREFYQSRGDSDWSMHTTSRKLTYYPLE